MELGDISPLDGISVLIVEDELVFRRQLSAFLSKLGANVTTADDGLSGLELLGKHTFDAILLDVVMPKLDGVGFLQQVSPPPVPVIVISGKSNLDDLRKVMTLGATDFLVKPIADFNELANTILTAISDKEETELQLELAELSEHKNALREHDSQATRVFNDILPAESAMLADYFYHYQVTGYSLLPLLGQVGNDRVAVAVLDLSTLAQDAVIAAVIANGYFQDLWDRHARGTDKRAEYPSEALEGLNRIVYGADLKAPLCCFYALYDSHNVTFANGGVLGLEAPFQDFHPDLPLGSSSRGTWDTHIYKVPSSSLVISKHNLINDKLKIKLLPS
ncbi:response regulator [Aliagarivorans marinus]|uniref:response regulator n=1 Tax=Aliagarivorans marinus TaxID=561965 RepID=UPI000416EA8B|nr:response regulator [Aliagarivorans marinus]